MYVVLFLFAWLAFGIVLLLWFHVRTAPRERTGPRPGRGRQQAILFEDWSRGLAGPAR